MKGQKATLVMRGNGRVGMGAVMLYDFFGGNWDLIWDLVWCSVIGWRLLFLADTLVCFCFALLGFVCKKRESYIRSE